MSIPSLDRSPSWRPQGADLYPTGAAVAIPAARAGGGNAPAPVESADRLGEGAKMRDPDKPSATAEATNRDWTEAKKAEKAKEEEPPKEPISKLLLEFIQSMWRASGSAVELAQEINKASQQDRQAQQEQQTPKTPLTYADPKVKRTSGL
ncbi:hypothetical protein [Acidovorax sp. Leaf160]|uniref:hypothetical protein n=1 Tax=Acidovorax sp. Leaf160 TaxID=1736280 RepID=UPI0006F2152D|nr:hypothetical protein [Acidovorax sp. Leaf160]KQR63267.1 hypothetical protein ASF94_01755 [Acidovorax sp. Leaf160]